MHLHPSRLYTKVWTAVCSPQSCTSSSKTILDGLSGTMNREIECQDLQYVRNVVQYSFVVWIGSTDSSVD